MPGNDLARQIKERLTARQVVELYMGMGIVLNVGLQPKKYS